MNKPQQNWKISEVKFLQENFHTMNNKELSSCMGRSVSCITSYARVVLKLKRPDGLRSNCWTKKERKVLVKYYGKKDCYQLAELIDRTPEAIRFQLTKMRKNLTLKAA